MSDINYYLGIDGGGTGCRGLLVDAAGVELARADGGAANVATDAQGSASNIADLVGKLLREAALDSAILSETSVVMGLAGANVAASLDVVAEAVDAPEVYVTDDREIVVAGALADHDGGLVAPGTGSFFACRVDGEVKSLGGWGYALGDEASGAWLGRKLLIAAIHAHDEIIEHSDLTRELLQEYDGQPSKMVQFANTSTPKEIASYAPRIVAAAETGDFHGRQLMQDGADWLELALKTLGYREGMPLVLWGGLARRYTGYLPDWMARHVAEPESDALGGAVSIARNRVAQS